MFQAKVVEKIKTHFVFSKIPLKIVSFLGNVEKYCRAWLFQAKVVEKIKTHFVFSNFFLRESCLF